MEADKPQPRYSFKEGATLLINKPKNWTSFDVVNKVRYKLKHTLGVKKIKVGHSGTLDPMATGLLVICTGRFTKKLQHLQGLSKTYIGTIKLGVTTPSYDAETAVDDTYPIDHITPQLIEETRKGFLGTIEQIPPMFSAIKVDGKPLYKRARKGEVIKIQPRTVHINRFDVVNVDLPCLDFEIECSKGTYIRSIAYDFGKAINSGGCLTALHRTRIGDFDIKDAWNLEDFLQYIDQENY